MSKNYIGVAPLTMIRTSSGGYVNVFAGDPVPGDIDKDDLKRLVDEEFLGEVEAPAAAADPEEFDPAKGGTVEDTLAYVGDDVERAKAVLEVEQAKDKPRSSLVAKLDAIANPAS